MLGRNYRVVEPIGAGAMGMVFVVEHVHLPRRFAAKILAPELARNPEAIARFELEAHAVSQLEHENIVSVVDYGKTDDGCVFIVMELLLGKTLQGRIDQGPLSLDEIVWIMIQVCRALGAAHAAGIVHRDMKPDNVFIHQGPRMRPLVKVLDFGVSKAREGSVLDGRITTRGQILGSPEYMSPEASRGEEVDASADVYAVGIMLYQLLCGDVPFRHENYLKVLQMHATQAPVPPRVLVPELSGSVEQLILRALEKDPARRQSCIEELELELTAAMPEVAERVMVAAQTPPFPPWARTSAVHSQVPAEPRAGTTFVTRRRRGSRALLMVVGGLVGVLAAAGTGVWLQQRDRGADRAPAPAGAAAIDSRAEPAEGLADRADTRDDGDETRPSPTTTTSSSSRAGDVHLRVDSSPRGANVSLEGRRLGRTPIDMQVPSARRRGDVVLELHGYRTARRSIARDRDGEVRVSLQREVRRNPQGGRADSSSRTSDGDRPDRSTDGPSIKERR